MKSKQAPQLHVAIFDRDGKQIGKDSMPDPRTAYCEAFRRLSRDGSYAEPVDKPKNARKARSKAKA